MSDNVEDIVAVIGKHVTLLSTGSRSLCYVARCPFHDERTPSFTVNKVEQTFHCFGCGVKGDVEAFQRAWALKMDPRESPKHAPGMCVCGHTFVLHIDLGEGRCGECECIRFRNTLNAGEDLPAQILGADDETWEYLKLEAQESAPLWQQRRHARLYRAMPDGVASPTVYPGVAEWCAKHAAMLEHMHPVDIIMAWEEYRRRKQHEWENP